MNELTYTVTSEAISVVSEGKPYTVRKGAANFQPLKDALHREDWNTARGYLTVAKGVETWAKGAFRVTDGQVLYKDTLVPAALNGRILAMAAEGNDPTPILRFWEKLQANPSWRSVTQLFTFMQHSGIPIDEDGNVLAYKAVREDHRDFHSGKFVNEPGATLEMARNQISDDPREACHEGFHVGALSYAQNFGGDNRRIVICRVDPADVVSVPYDESARKMRVSKYTVVGYFGAQLPDTTISHVDLGVGSYADPYVDDPDEDEVEDHDDDQEWDDDDDGDTTEAAPKAKKAPAATDRGTLDVMDDVDLMEQPLDVLRGYAARDLKIASASKIPGGKRALVARILEVRRS